MRAEHISLRLGSVRSKRVRPRTPGPQRTLQAVHSDQDVVGHSGSGCTILRLLFVYKTLGKRMNRPKHTTQLIDSEKPEYMTVTYHNNVNIVFNF